MSASLAHYRRIVTEHYAAVRSNLDPVSAAFEFRNARDELFRTHPLSAVADYHDQFEGLCYAAYDPRWRFEAPIDLHVEPDIFTVELPEGELRYQRFGRVKFTAPNGEAARLSLFWILGYGGGLFLPFGDKTNGASTYGGGRYLYDTIKGADLGVQATVLMLDFNFAYHPSCYYNPRWVCPLTPPENRLPFDIPVGELSQA